MVELPAGSAELEELLAGLSFELLASPPVEALEDEEESHAVVEESVEPPAVIAAVENDPDVSSAATALISKEIANFI